MHTKIEFWRGLVLNKGKSNARASIADRHHYEKVVKMCYELSCQHVTT